MSSVFNELENCFEYRGFSVCVLGNIENWKDLAKENNLIADSCPELVAWWMYHEKSKESFTGDFLILYNEPIRHRLD